MRKILLVGFALILASCSGGATSPTGASATVDEPVGSRAPAPAGDDADLIRVLDGDSVIMSVGGTEVEVRLLGINAPEGDECHGDAARNTLEQLLATGSLTLVAGGEDADQFGRALRYVYVDDLNVNLALIANGDALALQGDHPLDAEFASVGDESAAEGLGMWAGDACGSSAPDTVVIVDYQYNPPGRDSEDPNGEWVAVANEGDQAIPLGGWILRDESTQNRYIFPNGVSLASGAEIFVYSGCGDNTGSDLFWCASDPVWSNGGDTVILQLPDGTVVDRDRFSGDF